ncbi:MAG: class I SAM-dependent methyltransferase [Candidatus Magnetominusculus sp. LBB02]|nr:class I SAM-dependent methyltransferase [Candidatus Magnetominusculus sp. LBB02]
MGNFSQETHLEFYRRWNALAAPYFALQLKQFDGYVGRRVLDIGCGYGNFTSFMLDKDLYAGIDNDMEITVELNDKYRETPNIKFLNYDITDETCAQELRALNPDTVFCINLLEHIKDDGTVIERICAVLGAGGTLCILVPAFQFLYGTLDALDSHYRRYTKNSLTKLLSAFPLELIKMHYFNLPGALGWFIKGRLLKQNKHTDDNYRIMNALVPFVSKIEGIIKPPVGQSLIAVARRI